MVHRAFSRLGASLILLALAAVPLATPSLAQSSEPPAGERPLIYHGNHCGWGSRGARLPPTDALDAACRRHDICWARVGPNRCVCHDALAAEAEAIAADARTSPELREKATTITALFQTIPCE